MKSAVKKNEIAGRTAQKLPTLDQIVPDAADLAEIAAARPAPAFATAKNDPANLLVNTDSFPKFNVIDGQSNQAFDSVKDVNPASSMDRVARLVSQEVVTMKQSGANSVAVSLKVDAQTELFLQLTNHGGQLQATLRCERGEIVGLDSHWGKLQESLARQNVQLLPMQEKAGSQHSTYNSSTGHGASRQFNEQSQNPRSPLRELRGESTLGEDAIKSGRAHVAKTKTSRPQGWESWA